MALLLNKQAIKTAQGIELPQGIFIRIKPEHEYKGSDITMLFKYYLNKGVEDTYSEIQGITWTQEQLVPVYDDEGNQTGEELQDVRHTAPLKTRISITPEMTKQLAPAVEQSVTAIAQSPLGKELIEQFTLIGLQIQVVYHVLAKMVLEQRFGEDTIEIRLDLI